jgi:hypothetical protein
MFDMESHVELEAERKDNCDLMRLNRQFDEIPGR